MRREDEGWKGSQDKEETEVDEVQRRNWSWWSKKKTLVKKKLTKEYEIKLKNED